MGLEKKKMKKMKKKKMKKRKRQSEIKITQNDEQVNKSHSIRSFIVKAVTFTGFQPWSFNSHNHKILKMNSLLVRKNHTIVVFSSPRHPKISDSKCSYNQEVTNMSKISELSYTSVR